MNPLWNKPCNDNDRQVEQTCEKGRDTDVNKYTPTIGSRLGTWPCLRMLALQHSALCKDTSRHLDVFRQSAFHLH